MNTNGLYKTLTLALALGGLLACTGASPARAAANRTADKRIPVWVLRDADTLRGRLEHLRRQILAQTRAVDDARYRAAVRPQLVRTLVDRGLSPEAAEALLASVDAARARRF